MLLADMDSAVSHPFRAAAEVSEPRPVISNSFALRRVQEHLIVATSLDRKRSVSV